jgi:hypothetical protein
MYRVRDVRAPAESDRVGESGQTGQDCDARTLFDGCWGKSVLVSRRENPCPLAATNIGKICRLHNDVTCAFNSGMSRKRRM